jgi:hypothetical protein
MPSCWSFSEQPKISLKQITSDFSRGGARVSRSGVHIGARVNKKLILKVAHKVKSCTNERKKELKRKAPWSHSIRACLWIVRDFAWAGAWERKGKWKAPWSHSIRACLWPACVHARARINRSGSRGGTVSTCWICSRAYVTCAREIKKEQAWRDAIPVQKKRWRDIYIINFLVSCCEREEKHRPGLSN